LRSQLGIEFVAHGVAEQVEAEDAKRNGKAGEDRHPWRAHGAGLASGVVNTAFMMGGALGLAVLAALAEGSGYRAAFLLATFIAALAAILSAALLRNDYPAARKAAWASPSR
jgi:MFS family permease